MNRHRGSIRKRFDYQRMPTALMAKLPSVAFKEWAVVCQLMLSGEQSLILRKGGIAEGIQGFAFQHPAFLLFPTRFHEQIAGTTLPANTPLPPDPAPDILIEGAAVIERTTVLNDLDAVLRLAPLHYWSEQVVRDRFAWDEAPGISVAFLRVFRFDIPHRFPDASKFGGCRSWVELPPCPPDATWQPVLSDAEHHQRLEQFDALLGA